MYSSAALELPTPSCRDLVCSVIILDANLSLMQFRGSVVRSDAGLLAYRPAQVAGHGMSAHTLIQFMQGEEPLAHPEQSWRATDAGTPALVR